MQSRSLVTYALAVVAALAGCAAWAEPKLAVTPAKQPAHPDQPYRIVYEATWSGAPGAYSVFPPEFDAIEWGAIDLVESRSEVRNGLNVVAHVLDVTPYKIGDYKFPEVRVQYAEPASMVDEEQEEQTSDVPEDLPTLRVAPLDVQVRHDLSLLAGFGAFALVAGGCAGVWMFARRRRKSGGTAEVVVAAADLGSVQDALHRANQRRLDGEFYDFFRELSEAASSLDLAEDEKRVAEKLITRARDIGYGGVRPSDDEMDGALREVQRLLTRRQETESL